VEGDSLLAINVARKMQMGLKLGKVMKHWRLAKVTELILEHLSSLDGIILQVVRRMTNAVADCLANYGIDHHITYPDTCWNDVTCRELRDKCLHILKEDIWYREEGCSSTMGHTLITNEDSH